jgi:hypothetical protein
VGWWWRRLALGQRLVGRAGGWEARGFRGESEVGSWWVGQGALWQWESPRSVCACSLPLPWDHGRRVPRRAYKEPRHHLFTVDDPRVWELRSRLSDDEFAIADLTDEERDILHIFITEG